MPRNGAGVYSLPEPAFVSQTPISSGAVNSDFSDIAGALTASLARDGQGGMSAILPLAATGFNYLVDPNTGMSRSGADEQVITVGGINTIKVTTTGIDVVGSIKIDGVSISPAGVIVPFAGSAAPSGYLLCDGSAVSRSTYARLFAVIGTTYGSGDGSTTFNLPDGRGRVLAGKDNMGGVAAGRLTSAGSGVDGLTLGASGGAQNITLSAAQLPSITPTFTGNSASVNVSSTNSGDTTVVHATSLGGMNGNAGSTFGILNYGTMSIGGVNSSGSFTPSGTISSFGGGTAHGNVQPTLICNYIIKT